MENFINSGDSRETSDEIMAAIASLAKTETEGEKIWEDPSAEELALVWKKVTNNGSIDSEEFYWGASNNKWATGVLA